MTDFLTQILAFPTVVYTSGLVVVVIYWGFVIFGALDIDMFDPGGAADGALDGALDGAAEGAAEGAADAAFEGAGDAATEAAGEGAAEAAGDVAEGLSLASFIGLRKAPFTVVVSLLVLASWALCFLGMQYLAPVLGAVLPPTIAAAVVAALSFLGAMPITGLSARPLAPLFHTHAADRRSDLVGKLCRVETGTVDGRFGVATIEEGGGWSRVDVRCDRDNGLGRGDEALIIAYDAEREVFKVEPLSASPSAEPADEAARAAIERAARARRDGAT